MRTLIAPGRHRAGYYVALAITTVVLTAIFAPGYEEPVKIDSVYTTGTLVSTLDQLDRQVLIEISQCQWRAVTVEFYATIKGPQKRFALFPFDAQMAHMPK